MIILAPPHGLVKPRLWPVSPLASAAPWAWRDMRVALPLWEGAGDPMDQRGRHWVARHNSPEWIAGQRGPALRFASGDSDYLMHPDLSLGSLNEGGWAWTFLFRTTATTQQSLTGTFSDGNTLGFRLNVNSSASETTQAGSLGHFARSPSNQRIVSGSGNIGINDGKWHVATYITIPHAGSSRFVVDGVERSATHTFTNIHTSFADFQYPLTFGARNARGTIGTYFDGDIACILMTTGVPPLAEVQALHADLFALFRPAERLIGLSGDGGGGGGTDGSRVSTAQAYAVVQGNTQRVSSAQAYAVVQGNTQRVSSAQAYAVAVLPAVPDRPTITADPGDFSALLTGSAYNHPEGVAHVASQWQANTSVLFTTGGAAYDETDTYPEGDAPPGPSHQAIDLAAGTVYFFRVRYQDVDGEWGPWSYPVSAETEAASPPNTPSVMATPSFDQVLLEGSALSDPEDPDRTLVMVEWQVDLAAGNYSSPVAESLEDSVNLLSIILTGLAESTNYKARYRQRVDDGNWSAWSADEPFTTEAEVDPPSQPTASLQSKGARSLTLAGSAFAYPTEPGETHASTLVQVSTSNTFASAVTQRSFTPGQVADLLVDGLTPSTLYYYRIRYKASNGKWSPWSATLNTTTESTVFASGSTFLRPTFPRHGEVISGADYPVAWTPESEDGVTFQLEVAPAGGDVENFAWTPVVTDAAASPYALDTTVLDDGVYAVRMRATDGDAVTSWEYRTIVVDNAGNPVIFNANIDDGQPEEDFTPIFNVDGHTWELNGNSILNKGSGLASTDEAGLAYHKPAQPLDADVLIEVLNASTGGAFPWSWFPEQSWAGVGIAAVDEEGATGGIFATFYAIPIQAHGDCFHGGRGDGFLTVSVSEVGGASPVVNVNVPIGKIHFTKLFNGCNKIPRYGVRLRVTTVEQLPNNRRRVRIQAAVQGMEIDSDAVGLWHYDEEVEMAVQCGEVCYASREITTSQAYRSYTNITVMPTAYGTCEAPPEWEEPAPAIGEPCSLILQVYEEDEETIAWEVGTAQDHPFPYLALPENYAAQEVDFINGAATIGQCEVLVIDRRQAVGDQDSGWMTERLIFDGIPAIRNRRCRLLRWISPELGFIVIVDGPAGPPRLHESYAGYRWVIKDQRENERSVEVFTRTDVWALPMGLELGWGSYEDGAGNPQWLIPPTDPLVGTYRIHPDVGVITLEDYWQDAFSAGFVPTTSVVSDRAVEFPGAAYHNVFVSPGRHMDDGSFRTIYEYTDLEILWRAEGTEDPWTVVQPYATDPISRPDHIFPRPIVLYAGPNGEGQASVAAEYTDPVTGNVGGLYAAFRVMMRGYSEETTTDPWNPVLVDGDFPSVGQRIEFAIRYKGRPTPEMPLFLEYDDDGETRLTVGRLLKKAYDGEYSDLDPITGEVVPTGMRYDEEALLQLINPVRAMITSPVADLRQWSEREAYAPTGWAPTMDLELDISPTSQIPPDTFVGVPEVNDINAHPEPDWDAGELLVNVLEFTYPRFYVDESLDPAATVGRLLQRSVQVTYRDITSFTQKEEKATFDGSLFAAVGGADGTRLDQEDAEVLADERRLYLFARYKHGAQGIQVPVRRVDSALWKPGDWVVVNLSWIPDYLTQRRGGLWGGQVMMIADLNCAWRVVLVEEAVPLVRPPES